MKVIDSSKCFIYLIFQMFYLFKPFIVIDDVSHKIHTGQKVLFQQTYVYVSCFTWLSSPRVSSMKKNRNDQTGAAGKWSTASG